MKSIVAENFDIADIIPVGRANAVSRHYLAAKTGLSDRAVRKEIETSAAPIINVGYGYFIPDENDTVDRAEANHYCRQERARIRAIEEKLAMKFGGLIDDVDVEL